MTPAGRGNNNGSEPPPKRPQNGAMVRPTWTRFGAISIIASARCSGARAAGKQPSWQPWRHAAASPRGARIGLGVIALVAIGVWAASGFYIVQEGQVAVVTQFGKYKSTSQAGFQWRLPYPIQSHETVNVSQLRTFEVGFRGGARATRCCPRR